MHRSSLNSFAPFLSRESMSTTPLELLTTHSREEKEGENFHSTHIRWAFSSLPLTLLSFFSGPKRKKSTMWECGRSSGKRKEYLSLHPIDIRSAVELIEWSNCSLNHISLSRLNLTSSHSFYFTLSILCNAFFRWLHAFFSPNPFLPSFSYRIMLSAWDVEIPDSTLSP